ncbi:hypothetical protein CBL_03852, partial [Carabus blaptoides fortunei]
MPIGENPQEQVKTFFKTKLDLEVEADKNRKKKGKKNRPLEKLAGRRYKETEDTDKMTGELIETVYGSTRRYKAKNRKTGHKIRWDAECREKKRMVAKPLWEWKNGMAKWEPKKIRSARGYWRRTTMDDGDSEAATLN